MAHSTLPTGATPTSTARQAWRDVPSGLWVAAGLWFVVIAGLFTRPSPFPETHTPTLNEFATGVTMQIAPLWMFALALAPAFALWRMRYGLALAAAAFLPIPSPADEGVALQFSGFLALLGVACLGQWRRPRAAWGAFALALVVPGLFAFTAGGVDLVLPNVVVGTEYWRWPEPAGAFGMYAAASLAVMAVHAGIVRLDRRRRRAAAELHAAQVRVTEGERRVANESAAVEERARLARDLHDIVAHRISMAAVRAETAPYTLPDADAATRAVFEDIAQDARTALNEMRGVLSVLHRSSDGPELAPQPTGADVSGLVAEVRAAGTPVEVDGEVPELPEPAGSVVYRVVQEALTNARRHGRGPARVRIGLGEEEVTVRVANPLGEATPGPVGRGLTGMRERVELLGGRLDISRDAGEFVVDVRLPASKAAR